ncbi:MAG: hypothetical protein JW395_2969 [Nitrospira sp.]|nr:hypothetical protein [Nitrospira sp.]
MSPLLQPYVKEFLVETVGTQFNLSLLRSHGVNSGVYLVERAGERWVLKLYGARRGGSDPLRLQREVAMYRHLEQNSIQCTPKLVAYDEPSQASLLTFAEGTATLEQGAEDSWHSAAIDFVAAIQTGNTAVISDALPLGTDSCQSLFDHLLNVDRRIEGVGPYAFAAASEFHNTQIVPTWLAVRKWASTRITNAGWPELLPQMVSPGDLGPHNSVVSGTGAIVFLDFEYAGWDDPVKFLCDLEFQPSNHFSETQMARWGQEIRSCTEETFFHERYLCMRPVHAVKWASIALNPFLAFQTLPLVEPRSQQSLTESLVEERLMASDSLLAIARHAIQEKE